jgi:FixJ family two-component response regulator
MQSRTPLVLAATVSAEERRLLAKTLAEAGFDARGVEDAAEALAEISGRSGGCILVVDSGLLEMRHDGLWRSLRERAGLGTVVRSWIAKVPGGERRGQVTFLVHPDDEKSLIEAVRALAAHALGGR